MNIAILLFDNFETLDVYGPVEIFGRLVDVYSIRFYSLTGGQIKNRHGVNVLTENLQDISEEIEIFLIPGGIGTRKVIEDSLCLEKIKAISDKSRYVLTVCTGSALLAKTGLLDHIHATSNKGSFKWVMTNGLNVLWNKKARWTVDGKYYTSSGVSAGMDMALGFLSDRHGIEFARRVAVEIEYRWIEDKENDTFSLQ
jgi:putative intracellular protease/amidase